MNGDCRGQFTRYVLVGCVIFFLGMAQYRILYALIPASPYQASTTWVAHFLIGTVWTHAVHRHFTFRDSRRLPYFKSLLRTLVGYAAIHACGAAMMLLLCDIRGMHHMLGWVITTLVTALLNFAVMRRFSIVAWGRST
jgi:putative flippase GtrA